MNQPNIVLILADDMGYSDIGCFGSEIATPNLDALAAKGVRFSQMYNCARCCPSRASLLTGLYPHQTGIGFMVSDLGQPSYQGYLNEECVTIAEVLKNGGYRTALAGKWHVGGRYAAADPVRPGPGPKGFPRPLDRGFDRFFGTLAGSGSFYEPFTLMKDDQPIEPDSDFYYTDAISDYAAGTIQEYANGEAPFFLFVSYTAPHWPLHAPAEDIERYRGRYGVGWDTIRQSRHERLCEMGILDSEWTISPRDSLAPSWPETDYRQWEDHRMATYAAQIDRMDQGIGRILSALQKAGEEENTVVLFLSDNGGCAELMREDGPYDIVPERTRSGRPIKIGNVRGLEPGGRDTFMSYGMPWANASNTPFRLYKHWVHEGGVATPFVISGPGAAAGSIRHEPCHFIDIMATFCDLAGADYPSEKAGRRIQPLEGESLAPALRGERWNRERPIFWEHEGNRAVRIGDWKLVERYPEDWELYDLREDRTELRDLSTADTRRVREMSGLWNEWTDRCGVMPGEELMGILGPAYKAWLERGR